MGSKTERRLNHLVGKLIHEKHLIKEGDRILVGLSCGKDSWTLCYFLREFQKKAPIKFDIAAATLDVGYAPEQVEKTKQTLSEMGMAYHFVASPLQKMLEDHLAPGTSTCSFCARLRRAFLYKSAQEFGYNKIALGHHKDDFVETLLMNMFYHGVIKGMPSILKADNGVNELIRPLLTCEESLIIQFAQEKDLPIVKCPCGKCNLASKDRNRMKELVRQLEAKTPGVRSSIQTASRHIVAGHMF